MDPEIWGPHAWLFLHTITFNYPKNPTIVDRNNYYDFFNSLQNVLPCHKCQEHFKLNLQKFPIQLQSRRHLVQWLINMHNAVNIQNGKEIWSYDDVYEKYSALYGGGGGGSRFSSPNMEKYIIFIILIVVIIAAYMYYNKNFNIRESFY